MIIQKILVVEMEFIDNKAYFFFAFLFTLASLLIFSQNYQTMAIQLVIENHYFQGNSKYYSNFTSSLSKNKNGDPVIKAKFIQKVQISKEFVSNLFNIIH